MFGQTPASIIDVDKYLIQFTGICFFDVLFKSNVKKIKEFFTTSKTKFDKLSLHAARKTLSQLKKTKKTQQPTDVPVFSSYASVCNLLFLVQRLSVGDSLCGFLTDKKNNDKTATVKR